VPGATPYRSRGGLRDRAGLATMDATAANRPLGARNVAICSVGWPGLSRHRWEGSLEATEERLPPGALTRSRDSPRRGWRNRSCNPTRGSKLVAPGPAANNSGPGAVVRRTRTTRRGNTLRGKRDRLRGQSFAEGTVPRGNGSAMGVRKRAFRPKRVHSQHRRTEIQRSATRPGAGIIRGSSGSF
jgi:hypothetical protein